VRVSFLMLAGWLLRWRVLFVELFVVDILEIFVVISAQWLWGILVRRPSSRLWEGATAFTPQG
jgi:hypothetical protein